MKRLQKQFPTMNNYADTIAAISTPLGKGGVAVIRISGANALKVAEGVFTPVSKKALADSPRMQQRGNIYYLGEPIDDGLATYFKAPNSYTGEDTVEIACHGGMLVTRTVLEAVLAAGAHPADAGEFTRRAFINGKLSLTEAEAIGNLLEAESREQVRLASARSRTLLSGEIEGIRRALTAILSSIYARIDYPDEELGDFTVEETLERLSEVRELIQRLIATYQTGRAITEGIKTVICGKTNVGKSTLYNLLVGRDAAIVTDIAGTTRDVLTEKISLGKIMLDLADTAGVREKTVDPIEKIGIERSHRKISEAELIIAVFDLSRPTDDEDKALIAEIRNSTAAKIAVLNKSDLTARFDESILGDIFDAKINISAKEDDTGARMRLSAVTDALFTDEKIRVGDTAIISTARQNAALTAALTLTESAIDAYKLGISQDAASSDIERALGSIAEIDGRAVSEAVVADIFSKFCVGK